MFALVTGPIEIAAQWLGSQRGEDRKIDGMQFKRPGDLRCHKCTEPQVDAVLCLTSQRWFKNSRGLAVHYREQGTRSSNIVFAPRET